MQLHLGRLAAIFTLSLTVATGAEASGSTMSVTGRTSTPIGAYEFCQSNPMDCRNPEGDAGPLILTVDRWKTIVEINHQVNASIIPETDQDVYGVEERWTYPEASGDCEDFALLKRKRLIDAGFSPSDLLMSVVLLPNGEGHAVLTVRTDHGDFILDELREKVLLWSETEYTYLKRQSPADPAAWVKIKDGRSAAVGTIRR